MKGLVTMSSIDTRRAEAIRKNKEWHEACAKAQAATEAAQAAAATGQDWFRALGSGQEFLKAASCPPRMPRHFIDVPTIDEFSRWMVDEVVPYCERSISETPARFVGKVISDAHALARRLGVPGKPSEITPRSAELSYEEALESVDRLAEWARAATSQARGETQAFQPKRTVDEVRQAAEEYVAVHGFPGVRPLATALNAPEATVRAAVSGSTKLKAKKAEAKAATLGQRSNRPLSLGDVELSNTAQERELDPSEAATLAELIAEQAKDKRADDRPARARRR